MSAQGLEMFDNYIQIFGDREILQTILSVFPKRNKFILIFLRYFDGFFNLIILLSNINVFVTS